MKKVKCRGCGATTRLLDGLCWTCVALVENARRAYEKDANAANEAVKQPR